jgi:hypothetical protein
MALLVTRKGAIRAGELGIILGKYGNEVLHYARQGQSAVVLFLFAWCGTGDESQ